MPSPRLFAGLLAHRPNVERSNFAVLDIMSRGASRGEGVSFSYQPQFRSGASATRLRMLLGFDYAYFLNCPRPLGIERRLCAYAVGVPAAESNSEATTAPQLGDAPLQDVIASMTREEKVSLVMGNGMYWPGQDDWIKSPPQSIGRNVPGAAGTTYAIPRLGIPTIVSPTGRPASESILCGTMPLVPRFIPRNSRLRVCSPRPGIPATVERVGTAMGDEAKAYGIDILLAPALNVHRNPVVPQNLIRREMLGAMLARMTKRTEFRRSRALPTARNAQPERGIRANPPSW